MAGRWHCIVLVTYTTCLLGWRHDWDCVKCNRDWEAEQLRGLAGKMELRKLNHGSVVMKQGDQAAAMFFIKCGRVRVLRCIKSGPIARLLTLDPLLSARYPTTELHEL